MNNELKVAEANRPGERAMDLHRFFKGKMETTPRCVVRDIDDFSVWYSPGVAAPCLAIAEDPEKAYELTWKWNTIAVVSDGTRVLGLGDIGALASLPVMEGKALLFKYLGGVDAVPICLDTKDPDVLIETVKLLAPSFGGINLEDISQPKCFRVLDELRREMDIPVWHDDQQGTAAVTYAGLINALKVVGKDIGAVRIAMIGAGAANVSIARILIAGGVDERNMVVTDSKGTLGPWREELAESHREKWDLASRTNADGVKGGIREAMRGADVVIALSMPGPNTIQADWVRGMADRAIVFTCANPVPEIWPWEAEEAGAVVVATGRSDFPNQVNNSLGFPGIFRGALDVRATGISDEMCIAAAEELARFQEADGALSEKAILPSMEDWEVFAHVAAAVGSKAVEQGLARVERSREELMQMAGEMILRSRRTTQILTDGGVISQPPG